MEPATSFSTADIAAKAGCSCSLVRLLAHRGSIPRPDLSARPRGWLWSAEKGSQAIAYILVVHGGLSSCAK